MENPTEDVKPIETTALFIPLRMEYFRAFAHGDKTEEYRKLGKRWNETTCRVGRKVTLSGGYGKKHRLTGKVSYCKVDRYPDDRPGWVACYGLKAGPALVIGIEVDGMNALPLAPADTQTPNENGQS